MAQLAHFVAPEDTRPWSARPSSHGDPCPERRREPRNSPSRSLPVGRHEAAGANAEWTTERADRALACLLWVFRTRICIEVHSEMRCTAAWLRLGRFVRGGATPTSPGSGRPLSTQTTAGKLPFSEEPLLDRQLVQGVIRNRQVRERLQFAGDVVILVLSAAFVTKIVSDIARGKPDGAGGATARTAKAAAKER